LKKNSGVCWAAINEGETLIVPDVEQFPGHIACDSRSKSEIVIPLKNANNEIIGCLDVDSEKLANFDEIDAKYLGMIVGLIFKSVTCNTIEYKT
jgi:GAF domain-containing protein